MRGAERVAALAISFVSSFAVANAQSATPTGPCEQPGNISAIVDRPGLGRPTADNGSPCVVPSSQVVVEAGYRAQSTPGQSGSSTLDTYPLVLLRAGLGGHAELIVQPPAISTRSGAALGGTFVPAHGLQDTGVGVKWMLADRPRFQDAVEAFISVPTGTPLGTTGFSAGAPTYTLTYTASFTLTGNLSLSVTQNAIAGAAPLDPAGATRFFSYQPSLTIGYAFAPNFTLLAGDQIAAPLAPGAGTGNRALIAIQRVLSPAIVLDVDYEVNALPAAPAFRQHAFGAGVGLQL
jgi:hypothetical protein